MRLYAAALEAVCLPSQGKLRAGTDFERPAKAREELTRGLYETQRWGERLTATPRCIRTPPAPAPAPSREPRHRSSSESHPRNHSSGRRQAATWARPTLPVKAVGGRTGAGRNKRRALDPQGGCPNVSVALQTIEAGIYSIATANL